MVVLVTGAGGQLGQSLQAVSKNYPDADFFFANSTQADITNKHQLHQVFTNIRPDFCINAAAYTAVDHAEIEPDAAYAVNVNGVKNLAEICNEFNTTLVHISTDFVFDGQKNSPYTEVDVTNPQGIYGQTKRLGEEVIALLSKKYFIIRTSWLYSNFASNFMKTMLKLATEKTTLNVVTDEVGSPTHATDLVKAIMTVIQSGTTKYDIYHYSNDGAASRYEFAQKIFAVNDVSIDLIPILSSEFETKAKRPKYSALDNSKIKRTFNVESQNWQDALVKYKDPETQAF